MINKKNQKVKKALKTTIALMAVSGLTIAATLALLSAETELVKNTFTPAGDIKIDLTEPNWDQDGEASHFAPGAVIPKDPTVSIPTDSSQDEYVVSTVDYYVDINGDGKYSDSEKVTYDELTSTYADIYFGGAESAKTYNTSYWYTDDHEVFYYGKSAQASDLSVFKKGDSSVIFDTVVVKKDIPSYESDTEAYKKGQPIAFKIDVKSYGVQDSVEKETALKALNLMMEGKDPNQALK